MQVGSSLEHLGQRIREERLRLNLTQQEIAERCDVSLKSYQTFEKTGLGNTRTLMKVLFSLGRSSDILAVAKKKSDYDSIEEFRKAKNRLRQRASR